MSMIDLLRSNQVTGDQIDIKREYARHLTAEGIQAPLTDKEGNTFEDQLFEALNGVNSDQLNTQSVMTQMITNPDSVDVHDVTIAMAKADMSLNVTKAVIDRAVKAYKEITSFR